MRGERVSGDEGASMIVHKILLQAVERLKQAMGVTPNAFKREELAESRGGWVYKAGTVGACRAPR